MAVMEIDFTTSAYWDLGEKSTSHPGEESLSTFPPNPYVLFSMEKDVNPSIGGEGNVI
mgnify:CR=1 FL=1